MSGVRNAQQVSEWRRRTKERLVAAHGGVCYDCKETFPPFVFDFDHRVPEEKEFGISTGMSISYNRQYAESLKCDMVCANCHRMRTHRQRCAGCTYCV